MKRALDMVLKERGPNGYASFKNKLRLCSDDTIADAPLKFLLEFLVIKLALHDILV